METWHLVQTERWKKGGREGGREGERKLGVGKPEQVVWLRFLLEL